MGPGLGGVAAQRPIRGLGSAAARSPLGDGLQRCRGQLLRHRACVLQFCARRELRGADVSRARGRTRTQCGDRPSDSECDRCPLRDRREQDGHFQRRPGTRASECGKQAPRAAADGRARFRPARGFPQQRHHRGCAQAAGPAHPVGVEAECGAFQGERGGERAGSRTRMERRQCTRGPGCPRTAPAGGRQGRAAGAGGGPGRSRTIRPAGRSTGSGSGTDGRCEEGGGRRCASQGIRSSEKRDG